MWGQGLREVLWASIYGPGNTPFWISPSSVIPPELRDISGSLSGGAGTIIYGASPELRTVDIPNTQLILDAEFADWDAYVLSTLGDVRAIRNQQSIYLGISEPLPIGAQLAVTLTVDSVTYEVVFDPRLPQTAILTQIAPSQVDLGTIGVGVAINEAGDQIEVRIPTPDNDDEVINASLDQIALRTDGGEELSAIIVSAEIPFVDEADGIVYPNGRISDGVTRFSVSGALAQGSATWNATGRASSIALSAGDDFTIELDVTLNVPEFPESLSGLRLIGMMGLQPISIDTNGDHIANQPIVASHSNNGWSNLQTRSGLALDNMQGDIALGMVTVESGQVIRRGDQLLAGLRFELSLPSDLPDGVYVPTFEGFAQVGDGDIFAWTDNGIFGESETENLNNPLTRLPIVLNAGEIVSVELPMPLFYENPSDGSRGVLANEDSDTITLSNRVRFNSETYVLPPGEYPLEPYLVNQLANSYTDVTAPLMPVLFPGGRLIATITRPDGIVDELPSTAIVQNVLSTPTIDERDRYGAQSPVDVYRLTTLDPVFSNYLFDAYGDYQIELFTTFEDMWGNRYTGGGTYNIVIAEQLDLTPAVLAGTPFTVGDTFHAGLHLAPRVPADVSVRLRVYPLDGGDVIETYVEGQTSQQGLFIPELDAPIVFDTLGEYVVDYDANYTDVDGRVWSASFRSAGVIGDSDAPLILHGQRGLQNYYEGSPAWFTTENYPVSDSFDEIAPVVHYPYFSGDVVYLADNQSEGIHPVIYVQDTAGTYRSWLTGTVQDYVSPSGESLERLAVTGALPLMSVLGGPPSAYSPALISDLIVNNAYAYIGSTRAGVTVRQFVQGGNSSDLSVNWDSDDPLNGQIGAGILGDRAGDYIFLFGGAIVRNAEAGIQNASIYASLAVVGDEESDTGIFPPYAGAAGGPDGRALFTVRDEDVDIFFHPTATRAGDVLTIGDTLSIAGQVAPTLQSEVDVRITNPDGVQLTFNGLTNAIGYFYNPAFDFSVDEVGIWTVDITTRPASVTSAGMPQEPLPSGGVLGEINGSFSIFVVPEVSESLTWGQGGDVELVRNNPSAPLNIVIDIPQGWTETQTNYVITTPSYIVDDSTIQIFGQTASYQYNPGTFSQIVPNLEVSAGAGDASYSDVVTATFVVTGLDEDGDFAIRTRTFTFLHDRITSFEGDTAEVE